MPKFKKKKKLEKLSKFTSFVNLFITKVAIKDIGFKNMKLNFMELTDILKY